MEYFRIYQVAAARVGPRNDARDAAIRAGIRAGKLSVAQKEKETARDPVIHLSSGIIVHVDEQALRSSGLRHWHLHRLRRIGTIAGSKFEDRARQADAVVPR